MNHYAKREAELPMWRRIAAWMGLLFLLALMVFFFWAPMHAQERSNTYYAAQFAGADVGAKITAAQAQCSPNTAIPCTIVIDAILAGWPQGTEPALCSQCIWIDYRSVGVWKLKGTQQQAAGGATDFEINHSILATSPNGVFPLGGDININCRGSGDCWIQHTAAKATFSSTLVAGLNSNQLVANISPGVSLLTSFTNCVNAGIIVGRGTPNEENVTSCTMVDATHMTLTTAKAHTVNGADNNNKPLIDVEQGQGNTILQQDGGGILQITSVNPSQEPAGVDEMVRIAGADGVPYMLLPNSQSDAFPRNAIGIRVPITGTGTIGAGGGQLPTPQDLILRNAGPSTRIVFQTSSGVNTFVVPDSGGVTFTQDIVPNNPGTIHLGTQTLPVASIFIGVLANQATQQQSIATANRLVTWPDASGTVVLAVASGTATMTTTLIAAGACGTTVTVAATGVVTTDTISWSFNAAPLANPGVLTITPWVTANNVNFQYCNPTAAGVTPNAATLNWKVVR